MSGEKIKMSPLEGRGCRFPQTPSPEAPALSYVKTVE